MSSTTQESVQREVLFKSKRNVNIQEYLWQNIKVFGGSVQTTGMGTYVGVRCSEGLVLLETLLCSCTLSLCSTVPPIEQDGGTPCMVTGR